MTGALINNPKNMGLVMLPMTGLIGISGIFYPLVAPARVVAVGRPSLSALLVRSRPPHVDAARKHGGGRGGWVLAHRESGSTLAERRRGIQQDWGV